LIPYRLWAAAPLQALASACSKLFSRAFKKAKPTKEDFLQTSQVGLTDLISLGRFEVLLELLGFTCEVCKKSSFVGFAFLNARENSFEHASWQETSQFYRKVLLQSQAPGGLAGDSSSEQSRIAPSIFSRSLVWERISCLPWRSSLPTQQPATSYVGSCNLVTPAGNANDQGSDQRGGDQRTPPFN